MAMENVMKEMMEKELASNADTARNAVKTAAEKAAAEENVLHAEEELKFDGAGAQRLLDAIFGGQTEGIGIHIDTANIHIGDHMESVNFMGGGGDDEDEDEDFDDFCGGCDDCGGCDGPDDFDGISVAKAIHIDTDLMQKAVAKVTGIDRRIVEKVLDGIRIYLEVMAEQEDGHER